MRGWLSDASTCASRVKRAKRSGSRANWVGRTLTATSRCSLVSRARYTSPIPPAPMGARISYEPRRVPAGKAMRGEDAPIVAGCARCRRGGRSSTGARRAVPLPGIQVLDVPGHPFHGVAVRLDADYLVLNVSIPVHVERRRCVVHVEGRRRLFTVVAEHRHRELALRDVALEPLRIVVQADQDEADLRIVLVLLVGFLDERQLRPAGPSPG